jgi:hypothetical protein
MSTIVDLTLRLVNYPIPRSHATERNDHAAIPSGVAALFAFSGKCESPT